MIVNNISTECFLFADDSLLLEEVESPVDSAGNLNCDLNQLDLNLG